MVLDKKFWKLIKLDRADIGAIYFYAVLSGLVQLSVPLGIQAIIGFVLGAKMVVSIYVLIILVCLGVLVVGILQINQMKIIESIQQRIFTRNAFEFAEKIPKFDLNKTDNYYLPEKVNRFFDTVILQKSFAKLLLDIPTAFTQILFGLVLLSFYNPLFLVFGFFLLFFIGLILFFSSKVGLQSSIDESTAKYRVISWLQELAKSILTFKYNMHTKLGLLKTDQNVVNYLLARTEHFKILIFQYKTLVLFKVLITAFLLTVGVYLLINQKLNIGEFIAAEIVILSIINSVEKILKNLDSVYDVQTALEKLATIQDGQTEENGTLALNADSIAIKMNNFSYSHPHSEVLLNHVDLDIPAGSLVCISGEENSGKTTLLKILSACYPRFSSNLYFNNVPLRNFDLTSLRQSIQIFSNKQEIFSGSILENIQMGKGSVTEQKILQTAEELGFGFFLQNFPAAFQTKVETNGKKLPKNTGLKMNLLRALVPDSKLIVMEEPWNGLHTKYRESIINFLLSQKQHKTIVVASNDKEFAKQCDFTIMLENGNAKISK